LRLIEATVKGSTWLIPEKYFTAYNNFSCSSCSHEYFQTKVQGKRKRNRRRLIQEKRKTNNKTEGKKQIDGETNG